MSSSRRVSAVGARFQAVIVIRMIAGTTSIITKIPGTTASMAGASQRPAMKPRTTLGSAAMISTVGFTIPLIAGCMNWEV